MSQKITSKNLSYDNALPPFLAALRAQAGGSGGEPAPGSQRRNAKKRSASEDAEDVPLVVDEEGNVVRNVEVDKEGVVKEGSDELGKGDDDAVAGDEKAAKKDVESKAAIGGRKRKAGRVIGEAAEDIADKKKDQDKPTKNEEAKDDPPKEKKPKKKAKKIKLSFDEEDG